MAPRAACGKQFFKQKGKLLTTRERAAEQRLTVQVGRGGHGRVCEGLAPRSTCCPCRGSDGRRPPGGERDFRTVWRTDVGGLLCDVCRAGDLRMEGGGGAVGGEGPVRARAAWEPATGSRGARGRRVCRTVEAAARGDTEPLRVGDRGAQGPCRSSLGWR